MPIEPLGPRGENFMQTYQTKWGILQFHLLVPGLSSFDFCESRAILKTAKSGTPIKCLSPADMLAAKKAANRPRDAQDIAFLEEMKRLGKL